MKAKILLANFFILYFCSLNAQVMLKDIYSHPCQDCGSYASNFTRAGNYVYFIASDEPSGTNFELWKTDGTESGTTKVTEINPNGSSCGWHDAWMPPYLASPIFAMGNKVMFFADDDIRGVEPWISDGTPGGTQMIRNIDSSSASSLYPDIVDVISEKQFVYLNNKVLFVAMNQNNEQGIWVTDGTTTGTQQLSDQYGPIDGTLIDAVGNFGNIAYIAVSDSLYKTDGTSAGTHVVSSINNLGAGYGDDRDILRVGGNMITIGSAAGSTGLLVIDTLTYAQTFIDLDSLYGASHLTNLVEFNGKVYFWVNDGIHGSEFYVSDGTASGTHLVMDINPGSGSSNTATYLVYDGSLYFTAYDGVHTYLYKSDGTANGTVIVSDPYGVVPEWGDYGTYHTESSLHGINGKMFFGGFDVIHGLELWVTDGTLNGTTMFNEICPDECYDQFDFDEPYGGYHGFLYNDGNLIYFAANDYVHGIEPWILDANAGIQNVHPDNGLVLYPNPATDYFTLHIPPHSKDVTLKIFDLIGHEVKSVNHINQSEIFIERENLPAGIYEVVIFSSDQKIIYTAKVDFE